MPSEVSLRAFVDKSVQGRFGDVLQAVNSKEVCLQGNAAIKIVVAVCNFCYKNMATLENINDEDLARLIQSLLKLIHLPTKEQYYSYILSAFHILKVLIEKKNFASVLQLDDLLTPSFMPLVLSDKHNAVYQSICKTIYNVIVGMARSRDKSNQKTPIKLVKVLSNIHHKIGNKSNLLETMHNCFVALVLMDINHSHLLELYQHVLDPIDRFEDPTVYPLFINNYSFVYTHFLKQQQFQYASACHKLTMNKLGLIKGQEYKLLKHILDVAEWISPRSDDNSVQVPTTAHSSLKSYYKTYQSTKNLRCVCDFVSSVAYTSLQIYKKSDAWVNRLATHSLFYKFLNDVALIMAKTEHKCHCKACPTQTNINEALRSLITISGLGRLSVTNAEVTRIYNLDLLRYLDKAVEYVCLLKNNNCTKWEVFWYDIGVNLYAVGAHLHKKETETAISFLRKFVQTSLALDSNHRVIDKSYVNTSLNIIGDAYFMSRDYEKCLLVSALGVALNDSPKNEIVRWMRTKSTLREDTIEENSDLQEVTLVSVLESCTSHLHSYTKLELTTERKLNLLEYELKQYSLKWKSKAPMCATFKHLNKLADPQRSMRVFIEVWGDADLMVHDALPNVLHALIERVERNKDAKETMLAHLYFLQHKYRVKDTIAKHCDEMKRTMVVKRQSCESHDPIEECDIISSYECLKLSRYLGMIKHLNKALDLLHASVTKTRIEDSNERQRVYKLLTNIGHEFRLHSYVTKSLQAWELALGLAKLNQNMLNIVQVSGFIIEASDVRKPFVKTIVKEADESILALNSDSQVNDIIVYYLCKAEAFFYLDFDVAYGAFKDALILYNEQTANKILKARIHLLHHKFIMLPCKFKVQEHREFTLMRIHQAKSFAKSYYCESSGVSSHDMRMLFDIYDTVAKMYHNLRLPREVRYNVKSAAIIAQEMVLPLRTTSFLYYLAHADLTTNRMDDCQVKVRDFTDILSISNSKIAIKPKLKKSDRNAVEDDVDVIIDGFKEIMLDIPQSVPAGILNGSPTFAVDRFKLPDFVNHEDTCDCFYCMCVEYQHLVFKKTYLYALFYQHEDLAASKEYLHGCIKIYNCLKNKQEVFVKKMAKEVNMDLVMTPRDVVREIYAYTLLEYAHFCMRNAKYVAAEKMNKKLLDIVESDRLRWQYLYNEAFIQKLNLLAFMSSKESPKVNLTPFEDTEACPLIATAPCTPRKADYQFEALLANKTKLLTEKLKNSSRKRTVYDENQKYGIKQNILSQLDEAEGGDNARTVRRSRRNLK